MSASEAQIVANRCKRRVLQGVVKETALARKYENAAAPAFDRTLKQIAAYRREQRLSLAEEHTAARAHTDRDHAAEEMRGLLNAPDPHLDLPALAARLGSFMPAPTNHAGPIDAANFAIGKAAPATFLTSNGPRYIP